MINSLQDNSGDHWKDKLRSEILAGINGSLWEQLHASEEVGYYYQCCAPMFLYKYYNDTTLALNTIRTNQMWYSAPCNFNDVFDCDISINQQEIFNHALKLAPPNKPIRQGSLVWKELSKEISKQLKLLHSDFAKTRSTIGVACLSESENSLLMWAHYANNHRGMCVEYKLMEINQQLGFSPIPIIYSDDRACFHSLNPETLEQDSTKLFLHSITSKSPEWSYEREWRIIRDESACGEKWDENTKGALLDMIQPTSIILGCEARPEFEKAVKEYCETSKINLYKMEKDKALYRLNKKIVLEFASE